MQKKALKLLHNSNPTLFEWNSSPIVYHTTEEWKKISTIINHYVIDKAGLYHYLNTAKNNYREYLKSETVRLKKYFYVLRPILACKWIIDKGTPPPMPFKTLMDCYLDKSIKPAIDNLLELKINSPEIGTGKKIDEINKYIEMNMAEIEEIIMTIPDENKHDWNELNAVFIEMFTGKL